MLICRLAKQISFYFVILQLYTDVYTLNSEDLFQPQNAKLALRPLEPMQPSVGLFQPQLGQNYPPPPIESRNSPQWDPIWPFLSPFGAGPAPVNTAIMALFMALESHVSPIKGTVF